MATSERVARSHADRLLAILRDAPGHDRARARVLVVDTDAAAASVLEAHLPANRVEIMHASSVADAREVLARAAVTLIVCNPAVAGDRPWRFLSQLGEHGASAGIPIIVLRGTSEVLGHAELYSMGMDAVLDYPIQRTAFIALVQSRLKKASQQRSHMLQDPATGFANASAFGDAFDRASSLAAREHEPLTLLVLQVGALARVRGDLGVPAADDLLRAVARASAEALRQSDLLARGTGDTLLVLLPNTDLEGARRVVEKVYDRLQRMVIARPDLPPEGLLLSAGTAEAKPRIPFAATLEAAAAELEPVVGAMERALAGDAPPQPMRRHRVLIAEDDSLTARIIGHRIERLGHDATLVMDGAAALRLAPAGDFSLLILDVKMPYVDGFETLRRVRSIRSLRHLPVMMVTSMGNEDDIAHGFELGADDYLVKPFSPIELQARVQRMLRQCA